MTQLQVPTDKLIGLGRRYVEDARDRRFLIPRLASSRTARSWASPTVLDQAATPQCVGYATWKFLQSGPVVNHPPADFTPTDIYHAAQELDEWPGTDYEGTSVRGAFKALRARGYIEAFLWGYDVETVVGHLLEVGPVLMGTTWDYDMFTPDRWNYIWRGGGAAGGHAFLLVGVNRTRRNPDASMGAVRMINSWGPRWADHGRAWISFNTLGSLIQDDGEAGIATEVKLKLVA